MSLRSRTTPCSRRTHPTRIEDGADGLAVEGRKPLQRHDFHTRDAHLQFREPEQLRQRLGARELRDLVSVHSEWLSQEVPGFAEALAWPETPPITSPRGGGRAGAPGAKQAASRDETRGRQARRSDDAGRKTEAAMFSIAARHVTAADIDAVIR